MKYGNISNERAAGFGVRFEQVIKSVDGSLNKKGYGLLSSLAHLDYNIYIITTGNRRKALAYLAKWNVPYNYVLDAETLFEIADLCIQHELVTYYDSDKDVVNSVSSRGKQQTKGFLWTLEDPLSQE